jgi:hypothetical protein
LIRLIREVGKRVRGKGERANKNPFPFNLFPFPPLAKVTFARGLIIPMPIWHHSIFSTKIGKKKVGYTHHTLLRNTTNYFLIAVEA